LVNKFPRRQILGKQSVLDNARDDEAVFSMRSAPSNSKITGLWNKFLSNGSINIFPRAGHCYESGDVINNRDDVFHVVYNSKKMIFIFSAYEFKAISMATFISLNQIAHFVV
jgi:hypothetical protein